MTAPTPVTRLRKNAPRASIIVAPARRGGWYVETPWPSSHLSDTFGTIEAAAGFSVGLSRAFGFAVDLRDDDTAPHIVELLRNPDGPGWTVYACQRDDVTVLNEFRHREAAAAVAERLAAATGWDLIDWTDPQLGSAPQERPTGGGAAA